MRPYESREGSDRAPRIPGDRSSLSRGPFPIRFFRSHFVSVLSRSETSSTCGNVGVPRRAARLLSIIVWSLFASDVAWRDPVQRTTLTIDNKHGHGRLVAASSLFVSFVYHCARLCFLVNTHAFPENVSISYEKTPFRDVVRPTERRPCLQLGL